MFKLNNFLLFVACLYLTFSVGAKTHKVDQLSAVQNLINQAYKLGYVDAAPMEMNFIEKKVIKAKEARDNRKKKDFANLIEQIKADLRIVKKRYEVNQVNKQLTRLQQNNLQSKKMLDDLKGQLWWILN